MRTYLQVVAQLTGAPTPPAIDFDSDASLSAGGSAADWGRIAAILVVLAVVVGGGVVATRRARSLRSTED